MPLPASVQDVVARMEAIVAPLPHSDGVACFTSLYLAVTQGVQERLAGAAFADPAFLAHLDIVFASKQTNAPGLQVADLVARPIGRHVMQPEQPNQAWEILNPKFRRDKKEMVDGWGLKCFP